MFKQEAQARKEARRELDPDLTEMSFHWDMVELSNGESSDPKSVDDLLTHPLSETFLYCNWQLSRGTWMRKTLPFIGCVVMLTCSVIAIEEVFENCAIDPLEVSSKSIGYLRSSRDTFDTRT